MESSERLIYAGISEETSPASVVLLMIDRGCAIVYAKPGDQRWAVIEHDEIGRPNRYASYRLSSASTLQGRFYFATLEGNIMHVRLCPEPQLVPIVVNQPDRKSVV